MILLPIDYINTREDNSYVIEFTDEQVEFIVELFKSLVFYRDDIGASCRFPNHSDWAVTTLTDEAHDTLSEFQSNELTNRDAFELSADEFDAVYYDHKAFSMIEMIFHKTGYVKVYADDGHDMFTGAFFMNELTEYLVKIKQVGLPKNKVHSDDDCVFVECPSSECDNWETLGVDDPRKRLNVLPITEWITDTDEDGFEVSKHECTLCKTKFLIQWDYSNPIE